VRRALAVVAVGVLVVVVAFGRSSDDDEGPRFEPRRVGNLTLPAQVDGPAIAAATEDGFAPQFWPGVNLGSTIPGHQPGEVAATREDYARWLAGMGDLGVRVARIYTILRPAFYDAGSRSTLSSTPRSRCRRRTSCRSTRPTCGVHPRP
jgi:hypothetical protein